MALFNLFSCFFILIFINFDAFFAQELTFCECPVSVIGTVCSCFQSSWCGDDGMLMEELPVEKYGSDRIGDYVKCSDSQRCCGIPKHLLTQKSSAPKCGGKKATDRILTDDGSSLSRGDYPWLVAVLLKENLIYEFKGWGTLIHPQVVVTATHVLKKIIPNQLGSDEIKIMTSVTSTSDFKYSDEENQEIFAKEVIFHSPYAPYELTNDISLIILQKPADLNDKVGLLCLPPENYDFTKKEKCQVVGWDNPPAGGEKYTQRVTVPVVPSDVCQSNLKKTELGSDFVLHESFVCAGGEINKDACFGDGGSALICGYGTGDAFQLGITAWGLNTCGQKDVPGVYVNVPMFVPWIKEQLKAKKLNID